MAVVGLSIAWGARPLTDWSNGGRCPPPARGFRGLLTLWLFTAPARARQEARRARGGGGGGGGGWPRTTNTHPDGSRMLPITPTIIIPGRIESTGPDCLYTVRKQSLTSPATDCKGCRPRTRRKRPAPTPKEGKAASPKVHLPPPDHRLSSPPGAVLRSRRVIRSRDGERPLPLQACP